MVTKNYQMEGNYLEKKENKVSIMFTFVVYSLDFPFKNFFNFVYSIYEIMISLMVK